MKSIIRISKSQWNEIGRKAGWLPTPITKEAQTSRSISDTDKRQPRANQVCIWNRRLINRYRSSRTHRINTKEYNIRVYLGDSPGQWEIWAFYGKLNNNQTPTYKGSWRSGVRAISIANDLVSDKRNRGYMLVSEYNDLYGTDFNLQNPSLPGNSNEETTSEMANSSNDPQQFQQPEQPEPQRSQAVPSGPDIKPVKFDTIEEISEEDVKRTSDLLQSLLG